MEKIIKFLNKDDKKKTKSTKDTVYCLKPRDYICSQTIKKTAYTSIMKDTEASNSCEKFDVMKPNTNEHICNECIWKKTDASDHKSN